MNDDQKKWFIEKVAQNPEYIGRTYIPALELALERAASALHQANRTGKIEEIKYRMGWLDGAQNLCAVIDGLRFSDRKPIETGLMSRIFNWKEPAEA